MKLEPEQEAILGGRSGRALSLAMKTLVNHGRAFGASRLVPIKSAHLAGTFGIPSHKGYQTVLDQMVADRVRVKVPTTTNPRPGADLNLLNKLVFIKQKALEEKLEKLGVTPNYSCVCYQKANVPKKGDALGWAESSAVQFANSVIGARTNRNSVLIDLCSAVTGLTPEFGYLLDENRIGQVLIKLEIERMDAAALGFVIGQKVVDKVPVIEHHDFSWIELKNMGGAMAASGGVALFHVEGLTPEAPDLKTAFQGDPPEIMTVTQKDIDALRSDRADKADLVVFGCPQMTLEEATKLSERFEGKRVKKPTWFCMIPEDMKWFKETDNYAKAIEAGVEVFEHCPLAALTVRLGKKNVLSASAKCYYYLAGAEYGTIEDCLWACGVTS